MMEVTNKKYKRKKSNRQPYFNIDTQNAIIEYCNTNDHKLREDIFRSRIYPALSKLVEFSLRVYPWDAYLKLTSYEEAHSEIVSYLVIKLNKYDPNRGSLAYSYFNRIVKNLLIAYNIKAQKELETKAEVDLIDTSRDLDNEFYTEKVKDELQLFFELYIKKLSDNLSEHFSTKSEMMIADSLLEIFKYRNDLDFIFDKKTIYMIVRDMTNQRIETITPVVKKMKQYFIDYKRFYDTNHHLDVSGSYF